MKLPPVFICVWYGETDHRFHARWNTQFSDSMACEGEAIGPSGAVQDLVLKTSREDARRRLPTVEQVAEVSHA